MDFACEKKMRFGLDILSASTHCLVSCRILYICVNMKLIQGKSDAKID